MISNSASAIRVLAAVLTVLALVVFPRLPHTELTLVPIGDADFTPSIYGQNGNQQHSVEWIDYDSLTWRCTNQVNNSNTCGFSLILSPQLIGGLDLSQYDTLHLNLTLKGDATRVRVYVRNYNETGFEDRAGDYDIAKFMYAILTAEELKDSAAIKLSEFRVAEWWLSQVNATREHSDLDFSNVISFGIDYLEPGQHDLTIKSIKLSGAHISKEQFHFGILAFWMLYIIGEGLFKLYKLFRRSRRDNNVIRELVQHYTELEEKKKLYENLSITDPLTGIMNRAGLQRFVDHLYTATNSPNLGLILIDIDHFKQINDTRGHDVGDVVLKNVTDTLTDNTRDTDVLGRWGGEEFLIICADLTSSQLILLSEKLRTMVEKQVFEPQDPLQVTISLGVTMVDSKEPFAAVFKRLDNALYKAKSEGRNRYIFADKFTTF